MDREGKPVPEASVGIVELRRGAITDEQGRFSLPALPFGHYHVTVQRLGYASLVQELDFGADSPPLELRLTESLLEVPGAQITASAKPTTVLESPQSTTTLGGRELRTSLQPSIGATIEQLPGLRSWSTGSGVGKPSIRGLRSDRVLIVADGQRLENQQWGDEHGPQVETGTVERVEVIRGPASVLYGSDALGGVVSLVAPALPTAFGTGPSFHARPFAAYGSNGDRTELGATVDGGIEGFGWRGDVVWRDADDTDTPAGALFNSGLESITGGGAVGWRGGRGSIDARYSHRGERVEFHEDPAEDPGATPYQRIDDDLASIRFLVPSGPDSRVELRSGYERNFRREFEAADAVDVALGLTSETWTPEVRWTHPSLGPLEGVAGVSYFAQTFTKSGEESLIPNSSVWNGAAFVFEQFDLGDWRWAAGLRYDHRELDAEEDLDLAVEAQTRRWDAWTGNVGALYRVGEIAAVVVNAGRGFRAPSSFDLFSNGVHEGTVAYEVGDPTLQVEKSTNLDAAFRIQGASTRAEIGGFLHLIEDYIHNRPTGTFDPASGFEIFQTVQGGARLHGFEAHAEWHPDPRIHLVATVDRVIGDNTDLDQPLPWIPPLRAIYGVRWEPGQTGVLEDPYVGLRGESVAEQTRLDPFDSPTAAYTLAHVEAGFGLPLGLDVDFGIRNVFDTEYRDFMSRYKTFAAAPGRDASLRLTGRF
jgi:iron complex outermembrane receptor protein